MPRINEHYRNLKASYLFAEIKRRTAAFREAHPEARLINLGIGDVTQPLPPAVIRALEEAAREMARAETFKGYGPYVGYDFLRAEIAAHDFGARGVKVALDEVFVSDGGKSDCANLQEIFAPDCVVALMDQSRPVPGMITFSSMVKVLIRPTKSAPSACSALASGELSARAMASRSSYQSSAMPSTATDVAGMSGRFRSSTMCDCT